MGKVHTPRKNVETILTDVCAMQCRTFVNSNVRCKKEKFDFMFVFILNEIINVVFFYFLIYSITPIYLINTLTWPDILILLIERKLRENCDRSHSHCSLIDKEAFEVDVVITVCSRLKSHCNKSIKQLATWSSTLKLSNFPNNDNDTKFSEFLFSKEISFLSLLHLCK